MLAGAVVSNVLTRKAHASNSESNKQVTTIQNGPLLPNGCYEQTMRESDKSNSRKIVETVHLVCPSAVPVSVATPVAATPISFVQTPVSTVAHTPISVLPTPIQQQAPQTIPLVLMPEPVPAQLPTTQTNSEFVQHGFVNPSSQHVHQPMAQIPQVDTANLTSTTSQHIPQLTIQNQPPQTASPSILMPEQVTTQIPAVASQLNPGSVQLGFVNPSPQHVHHHQATIQTQMVPQISTTNQQIPQVTTTQIPTSQAPKVYVISKRTEYYKKKSAAINHVLGNHFLIYSSIILLIHFM